jgi:K+-transporting ATPase ATPase C chain
MKQDLKAVARAAAAALLAFTVLTGIIYPALVLGLGQALFPHRANGSLIVEGGRVVGSELVGQAFTHSGYFWSRPSAVAPFPYNAATSGGTNEGQGGKLPGQVNADLHDAAAARIAALRAADPGNAAPVPADLVTASASGLDPHITPAAAYYQADRVARARRLPLEDVRALIAAHVEPRTLGLLGEPRVNVLALNRALDARTGAPR